MSSNLSLSDVTIASRLEGLTRRFSLGASSFSIVRTSSTLPAAIIPSFLYPLLHHISLFNTYFLLISVTLAVFNLLPLPILDGGLLLSSFLEWLIAEDGSSRTLNQDEEAFELELLEAGAEEDREIGPRSRSIGKRRRWERRVHLGVGGLGCWALGGVMMRMLI